MKERRRELLERLSKSFPSTIVHAFGVVPREQFVPDFLREQSYMDIALPLGKNQSISQPSTIAFMLTLLELGKQQKILEIGSGTGYVLALLAAIVDNGYIYGVEVDPVMVEQSRKRLDDEHEIRIIHADGSKGLVEHAPFDRILVSADVQRMPRHLIDQLSDPGILVAPVGGVIQKIIKKDKAIDVEEFPGFSFVPLVSRSTLYGLP